MGDGAHLLLAEGVDGQAVLRRGVEAGAEIHRFELVEPRLHEIFVRHAGGRWEGDRALPPRDGARVAEAAR